MFLSIDIRASPPVRGFPVDSVVFLAVFLLPVLWTYFTLLAWYGRRCACGNNNAVFMAAEYKRNTAYFGVLTSSKRVATPANWVYKIFSFLILNRVELKRWTPLKTSQDGILIDYFIVRLFRFRFWTSWCGRRGEARSVVDRR